MWRLLTLLALGLGAVGLGRAELSAAQQQGLQVALEEFHKHPRVQWAFQKTSVDSATDTVSSVTRGRGGSRPHPKRPAHSRGAGARMLGLCVHAALRRKATTSHHCSHAVSLWGGGIGHIQELLCPLNWLLAFLCLSCRQPYPAGTFVRLEFKLQQTGCWKKDWKKPGCTVKPTGVSRDTWLCMRVMGRLLGCSYV